MRVDATSYGDAADRIVEWACRRESRYVCVASVNNVMHSHNAETFRHLMNTADLVTPDGMPLVWGLRVLGLRAASRVRGTNLMEALCDRASDEGLSVGFYGGTPEALDELLEATHRRWPHLRVGFAWSPPFRPLSEEEDKSVISKLASSDVAVVFVGLSTPKQDDWMACHRGRVPAVMVGVGAAFDFLSGRKKQAPLWMQRAGIEWLFRLLSEPRRLWRRYLSQNPRFVLLFGMQLLTTLTWDRQHPTAVEEIE